MNMVKRTFHSRKRDQLQVTAASKKSKCKKCFNALTIRRLRHKVCINADYCNAMFCVFCTNAKVLQCKFVSFSCKFVSRTVAVSCLELRGQLWWSNRRKSSKIGLAAGRGLECQKALRADRNRKACFMRRLLPYVNSVFSFRSVNYLRLGLLFSKFITVFILHVAYCNGK